MATRKKRIAAQRTRYAALTLLIPDEQLLSRRLFVWSEEATVIVELHVRTAWSDVRTARAVLDAQADNVAKGERALELAQIRYNEGDGTQIDVLNAQTALTEAHGSFVDALRNYSVARASLLRATGIDLQWSSGRR
jgi:outer membrane protein TolC